MRLTICLSTVLTVCALATPAAAKTTAKPAGFQLAGTSWTYVDKKEGKLKESIDADGNYIAQTIGGKHIDHGTAVMKSNKACFTSKMTKEGEICWTTPSGAIKIGHSFVAKSDKGQKLKVTRAKYMVLKMPG